MTNMALANIQSPREHEFFQICAILLACTNSISTGLLFSWSSPTIPKIAADKINYDITLEEASYFTVLPPIGMIFSSIVFSKLIDVIGRKWTVWFISVPYLISWIIIAVAKSVSVFYIARFITGIGDAILFASLPVYIAEIASPKIRGTWGNSITLFIYFGQFLINVIGSYLSIPNTAYVCMMVPILFLITFPLMPESPYYYIMKRREDEAKAVLQKLKGKQNVDEELKQLMQDVNRQLSERGTWKDLFMIPSNRIALLVGIFLRASQQLGGISTFAVYTQYIFLKSGGNLSASTSSIIFTGLLVILNFIASFTLEKIGRQKSYTYSCLCCGIILSLECAYFFIDQTYKDIDLTKLNWIPIAGMITFVVFYSFGLGIIPTLMLGELFSASVKSKGLCVLSLIFALLVSGITKLFQVLESNIGLFSPFLLFTIACLLSTVISVYIVPETKGKSLEEIQQSLKGQKDKK